MKNQSRTVYEQYFTFPQFIDTSHGKQPKILAVQGYIVQMQH